MNTKTAIKIALDGADMICMSYLQDLTDDEMMHRPHAKCNHIKWQLGHLIESESSMIGGCYPTRMPKLPDGFADKYLKETAQSDRPSDFDSKEFLLEVYRQQRSGTLELLAKIPESDLDQESPESIRSYAPNFGSAFLMQETHWMMHAGQWAVIRRQLGREPLF